ncbi:hypothetical protein [Paenibacillus sp. FSL H8-0259]|uniref:hypothetical protein n=1 Tax=Paenibacillus sp. FSL H8-0259 TaxID=1920423 RepID=UPI00096C8BE9|nr:hypothetical protein [Paenibacillus sp. FSL H8-0259]OMF30975.1 hypothetical protein BK132_05965 [Paenibacillus sp. FSL H8-0259]
MVVVKKVELSIDLTRPAEELIDSIISVLSFFPGRQQEILQKVDHTVGDMLAAMQPKEDPGPVEKIEESP